MPAVTNYATGADSTRGTVTWTNPGNVASDNGVYATLTGTRRVNSDEYWLIPTFSTIPAGSTITSVLCEVQWKIASAMTTTRTFQLYAGTTALTPNLTGVSDPTTDTTQSWSPTATLTQLQTSGLAVLTRFNPDTNNGSYSIDFVRVTVNYTAPGASTTGAIAATGPRSTAAAAADVELAGALDAQGPAPTAALAATTTTPPPTSYATPTLLPIPAGQATTGNIALTLPAGIVDGNPGVIAVSYNHTSSTTNTLTVTPEGWTLLDTLVASTTSSTAIYTRSMLATDSGTVVTVDASSTTGKYTAAGAVAQGTTGDLSVRAGLVDVAVATVHANAVATGSPPRVALSIFSTRGSVNATTITPPTGFTTVTSIFNAGTGATGISVAANLALDSDGTVGEGDWQIDGTGQGAMLYTFALQPATVTAPTGTTGALAAVAPQPSASAAGNVSQTSSLAATSQRPTGAAAASVTVAGSTAAVGPRSTAAAAATATTSAQLAAAGPAPTASAPAVATTAAQVVAAGPARTAAVTATSTDSAQVAAVGPSRSSAISAASVTTGQLSATGPARTAALAAAVTTTSTIAATGPTPTAAVDAAASVPTTSGSITATGPRPVTAAAGISTSSGDVTATQPRPAVAAQAVARDAAQLAAAGPAPSSSSTADVRATGSIAAAAPRPVVAAAGQAVASADVDAQGPRALSASTATLSVSGELVAAPSGPESSLVVELSSLAVVAAVAPTPEGAGAASSLTTGVVAAQALKPVVAVTMVTIAAGQGVVVAAGPAPSSSVRATVTAQGSVAAVAERHSSSSAAAVSTSGAVAAVSSRPTTTLDAIASLVGVVRAVMRYSAALRGTVTTDAQLEAAGPLPQARLLVRREIVENVDVQASVDPRAFAATVGRTLLYAASLDDQTAAAVSARTYDAGMGERSYG